MHPVENTLLWQRIATVLEVGTYARTLDAMREAYDKRLQEISELHGRNPSSGYDMYFPYRQWNTPGLSLANAFSWEAFGTFRGNDWRDLFRLMHEREA